MHTVTKIHTYFIGARNHLWNQLLKEENACHCFTMFPEDDQQRFLARGDHTGATLLHFASSMGNIIGIRDILEIANRRGKVKWLLERRDTEGRQPVDVANDETTREFLTWAKQEEHTYLLLKSPAMIVCYSTEDRKEAEEEISPWITTVPAALNLEPIVLQDPSAIEINDKIREVTSQADLSGLILVLASHGSSGMIRTRDEELSIQHILKEMNSDSLMGKPKVRNNHAFETDGLTSASAAVINRFEPTWFLGRSA